MQGSTWNCVISYIAAIYGRSPAKGSCVYETHQVGSCGNRCVGGIGGERLPGHGGEAQGQAQRTPRLATAMWLVLELLVGMGALVLEPLVRMV